MNDLDLVAALANLLTRAAAREVHDRNECPLSGETADSGFPVYMSMESHDQHVCLCDYAERVVVAQARAMLVVVRALDEHALRPIKAHAAVTEALLAGMRAVESR